MNLMSGEDPHSPIRKYLENSEHDRLSLGLAITCVAAFASILFIWKVMIALGDPSFTGDAAVRMLNARRPIAPMGNRVWLPYLQVQIWLLSRFEVPYSYFNLIPCLHLFLAVLGLGLLGLRFLGRNWEGLLISLAVMFCFAQQRVIAPNSTMLYQEIIGIALFYLLLYGGTLELAKRRWLLLVGATAMLARDSIWIYLFTLTLLNVKKILSDIKYRWSFAFLWTIPPLWLIIVLIGWLVLNGRLPTFPTEWPLMINKEGNQAISSLAASLQHLWKSAFSSRAVYLVLAGVAAWVVHGIESRRARTENSLAADFARRFKPFTLLSLAICYSLIFLFDPWQYTEGSGRMYVPVIEQTFIWFILIAAAARTYRPSTRAITMALLMAGMLASLDTRIGSWIPVWNSAKVEAYEEVAALIDKAAAGRKPMACMIGNKFGEMSDFSAATYRASHDFLLAGLPEIPDSCDALFTTSAKAPVNPGGMVRVKDYTLDNEQFILYLRPH